MAERISANLAKSSSAGILGSIFLQIGDFDSATEWLDRARAANSLGGHSVLELNNWSYFTEMAIRRQDAQIAAALLAQSVPVLTRAQSTRGDARRLALETQIALLRDAPVSGALVQSLDDIFKQTRSACLQDFNAESLLLGLESVGRLEYARSLAAEYLSTYRRNASALSANLQTVVNRLLSPRPERRKIV
jgi:hypothetical protein